MTTLLSLMKTSQSLLPSSRQLPKSIKTKLAHHLSVDFVSENSKMLEVLAVICPGSTKVTVKNMRLRKLSARNESRTDLLLS